MKKFWKWMYNKHGWEIESEHMWIGGDYSKTDSILMLIGYMIEYLSQRGCPTWIGIKNGKWESMSSYYKRLKDTIKEINDN
jgi:hypothetical protein